MSTKVDRNKFFKNDKIVVKNSKNGRIRKLIFPHEVDFGLLAHPELAEKIRFFNGLSGSITQLTDGRSYIVAGAGITVTSGSNGQVTVAATGGAGAGDITGVTAGSGLSGGGTTGTVTLNLDIAGLSTSLDDSTVSAFDLLAVADVNDSNNVKKITIEQVSEKIAGDGLNEALGVLRVDINGLTAADINVSEDFIAFSDEGSSSDPTRKESIADFMTAVAGTGLVASNGSLSVDLSEVGAAEIDVANDSFLILDANDSNSTKKEAISDLVSGIAGTGLSESSGQLSVGSLTVAQGGTGATSFSDKSVIITQDSGTDTLSAVAMSSNGQLLIGGTSGPAAATLTEGTNISITNSDGAITITASGVAPGAAGSNTQIQFNDGGSALGGDSNFTFNKATDTLTVTNITGSLTKLQDGTSFLIASGATSIASGNNGSVTISSVNTEYNAGDGLDLNSTTFSVDLKSAGGLKIHLTELAIDDSIAATISGSRFTGATIHEAGLTGSLTRLADGRSYLVAGSNVTITSQSNSQITISSLDTLFTAGTGINLTTTEFSIDDSVVATISGSTFSGATKHNLGLSGSLTHLADGTSYLVAGSNVTIVSASNGAITISAAGGSSGTPGGSDTQVQFNDASSFGGDSGLVYNKTTNTLTSTNMSGSLTRLSDGTSYIKAGANISITTQSNGSIVITGSAGGSSSTSIGDAEDGDYTDGLFVDFTSSTEIGTAVDRFNEVLKSLAPSPAPDLDDINSLNDGTGVKLSFGSSNDQSSESPAYVSVAASAGIGSAVDVNGSYTITTASNNLRLGAFQFDTNITGTLNADISANSQGNSIENFPKFSFGNGDTGILKLEVNGTTIKEIDFTVVHIGSGTSGIGSGSHKNSDGSGFIFVSGQATGTFSNGNPFDSFKHRTGKFVVASGSQRRGWNYARVIHSKSGSTSTTNYVEWVNDDNSDAISAAGSAVSFEGGGSIHLSGVEYFLSGNATYQARVSNAYSYVYDDNDITFTTSNTSLTGSSPVFSIANQSKPTIGGSEDHTKILHITGSGAVTANYFLSGALTASINVTHPFKTNLSSAGSAIVEQILMYSSSNTSTNQVESFNREDFRILSGVYSTQTSLTSSSNVWNSTVYMTASNAGHSNGLQFFGERLVSPKNTIHSGKFSDILNGPSDNPDYSGQSGQRTFYRWFKNQTGSTKYDLSLLIKGSGTIVSSATSLNTSRIRVFIKYPDDNSRQTGWLDLATEFVLDEYDDNDGAHTANGSLSFDSSLDASNIITLGTVGIQNNQYIGIRIEADATWTGHIEGISVTFGAGTGTITAIPDLDDIDCNVDGTDCNLSFGSSKSITGYTNVGTTAGFSAVDVNGLYETQTASNNLRRSVFALNTNIEGDLNEDVSANSPEYVANSFSDANSGSLDLEVNGTVIFSLGLTGSQSAVGIGNPGSGTGIYTGSNSSGFFNVSIWKPAEFDNDVPFYLENARTGRYRVSTADQRNGWNYARVIHSASNSSIRVTNYVEWVNDVSGSTNDLTAAGVGMTPFEDDNIYQLSGVKYFVQPSGSIVTRVSNLYKNVYSDSDSAISFTNLMNSTGIKIAQSGSGLSAITSSASSTGPLQSLSTITNSQNFDTHITGTVRFALTASLSGSYTESHKVSGSLVFDHPFKNNLTTTAVTSPVLQVFSSSDNSNANTAENFTGEIFRLQSGSFTAQSQVTSSTFNWSSTGSLNDNSNFSGYYTGLMLYGSYLISPLDGGNSGDFRNVSDGGILDSPSGNVNYSSLGVATREYYRGFLNNTSNDLARISITLYGDATLVPRTTSLSENKNIHVEVKVPAKTGFLDLGRPSLGAGNISDGDGCLFGDLNANIDSDGETNVVTWNGATVDGTASGAEYFVIKISAHKDWTGFLSQIAISWSG